MPVQKYSLNRQKHKQTDLNEIITRVICQGGWLNLFLISDHEDRFGTAENSKEGTWSIKYRDIWDFFKL